MITDTEGMRILARRDALTTEDWLKLLEVRRLRLTERMRDMTLKTLGEIRFIKDYFGEHCLKKYSDTLLVEGDPRFNLETRGIFPSDRIYANVAKIERRSGMDSVELFWGLTRDGIWISIEVLVTLSMVPYKSRGRFERSARGVKVTFKETTPEEICRFYACPVGDLWERLGEVAEEWCRHRRILYKEAKRLADSMRAEKELLEIVSE